MEFIAVSYSLPKTQHALAQYLLSRINLIDEREISDSELAQEVFLLKHRKELSKKVEKRLVPKVLEDIDFILKEGCAREISKTDFNHAHLCKVSDDPIFDVDTLLSPDNVRLLYHTCEGWFVMPYFAKRNIKSSLVAQPEIIPIDYEEFVDGHGYKIYRFSKTTFHSSEVGWSEYAKIKFEKNPNGRYKLKNGTKLEMRGIIHLSLIHHIKINYETGIIEFNGKRIGRAVKV